MCLGGLDWRADGGAYGGTNFVTTSDYGSADGARSFVGPAATSRLRHRRLIFGGGERRCRTGFYLPASWAASAIRLYGRREGVQGCRWQGDHQRIEGSGRTELGGGAVFARCLGFPDAKHADRGGGDRHDGPGVEVAHLPRTIRPGADVDSVMEPGGERRCRNAQRLGITATRRL